MLTGRAGWPPAFALLLTCAALSMGSTCSPSEPGCEHGQCEGAEYGEVPACINFCQPVWDGPIVDDVFCALDPCDEETVSSPEVFRCPNGGPGQHYTCAPSTETPDPDRIGVCRPADGFVAATCTPGEDTCEEGSFCLKLSEDSSPEVIDQARRLGVPTDAEGFCWLPVREGETCDGNFGRGEGGERPCEHGTWCRETEDGPRCLRACATTSAPDEPRGDLCACSRGEESCLRWEEMTTQEVPSEEPQFYCKRPDVPPGLRCDPQSGIECVDGYECLPTEDPVRGYADRCCRPEHSLCSSDADCCVGRTSCVESRCEKCGIEGDPAGNAGCCTGYVPVEGICRSCSSSPDGRAARLFGEASCDGLFVQPRNESGITDTIAVPVHGNTGAGPAELPSTAGRMRRVRYDLRPEHRLFLLEGDLTGEWNRTAPSWNTLPEAGSGYPTAGVTTPQRYFQMPGALASGSPREIGLDAFTPDGSPGPSTWTSLRVYDAGSCSQFTEWNELTEGVTAAVNKILVDPQFGDFGSSPMTLDEAKVVPILAAGAGTFGRSVDGDQLNLYFQYRADNAFSCPGARVRVNLGLRLQRRPAVVPTPAGEQEDIRMLARESCSTVGCLYDCSIDYDEYECSQRVRDSRGSVYTTRTRLPRDVIVLRDSYDFIPEVVFFDGGVVDCWVSGLNWVLRNKIRGKIEEKLPGILRSLLGRLDVSLPDRRLGIAFSDLTDCGVIDADSGELRASDATCAAAPPVFGNRRLRCLGFDDDGAREDASPTQFRCAKLRPEIRRISLRPDGIEVVLADDAADPQEPLIQSRFGSRCADDRGGSVAPTARPVPLPITVSASLMERTALCDPDLTPDAPTWGGCRGICGDRGVPCTGILAIAFRDDVDSRDRCFTAAAGDDRGTAQCCRVDEFCQVSGGLEVYESPATPEEAFWSCVDLQTDAAHCGACGNTCESGQTCCGGGCTDLGADPMHCGACGTSCGAGSYCSAGTCCAEGTATCDGDGVCIDLSSDSAHCGACGRTCVDGFRCVDGSCRPAVVLPRPQRWPLPFPGPLPFPFR